MKLICLHLLLAVVVNARVSGASILPAATPEAAGMSAERLGRVDAFIARLQTEGKLAGAVTVVARNGQLVSLAAHGWADLEARRAMRTDDIFQIQSMTKPVTTVAVLMLLEEGRFLLSDPLGNSCPNSTT